MTRTPSPDARKLGDVEYPEALKRFGNPDDCQRVEWLWESGFKSKFELFSSWDNRYVKCTFSKRGVRIAIASPSKEEGERAPVHSGIMKVFVRQGSGGYKKIRDSQVYGLGDDTFEKFKEFINDLKPEAKDPSHKPKQLEVRQFKKVSDKVVLTVLGNGQFNVYYVENGEVKKDVYENDNLNAMDGQHWEPNPNTEVTTIASRSGNKLSENKNVDPGAEPFFIVRTIDREIATTSEVNEYWELHCANWKPGRKEYSMVKDSKKCMLSTKDRDVIKIIIHRYMEEFNA